MLRCKKCNKLGLFRSINPNTGVCLDCEHESVVVPVAPSFPISPEPTIHIPLYYVGNGMRYIRTNSFDDVSVDVLNSMDYSKIKLCSDITFSLDGDNIIAFLKSDFPIGEVCENEIKKSIQASLNKKLPIFAQICGYDSKCSLIDLCVAFYKIEKYDYSPEYDDSYDDIDPDDIAFC